MRIERIVAHAFGPFRGEALDLADGLTVVYGPNEAGKSSWHAALRMAITGIRRGRGRMTAADAALAERHRPWDGPDAWEVEARLALDDGRRVDVHQDLAGKVACAAIDVDLGRDVSDEILDGTPDASRWLGLDRDAFASTISVEQAHVLAVVDSADQLQQQMQRAAATRGTDQTAAQAIERLLEFRREAIGADTVAAKGPLRMAKVRLAAAAEAHRVARDRHEEYLHRAAAAERTASELENARLALDLVRAARARLAADRAASRHARASELAERHPSTPAPFGERDAQADLVAAAVDGWSRRPTPPHLEGPSARDLERELSNLPEPPSGDLAPHADVVAAARAVEQAAAPSVANLPGGATAPGSAASQAVVGWLALGFTALAGGLAVVGSPLAAMLVAVAAAGMGALWMRQRLQARDAVAGDPNTSKSQGQSTLWHAHQALRAALLERGHAAGEDVMADFAAYQRACEARAEQAREARRAVFLRRELATRIAAEEAAAGVQRSIDGIDQAVRAAADALTISVGVALSELVDHLRAWQTSRAKAVEQERRAHDEWAELRSLLDGTTLEELRQTAERRRDEAQETLARIPRGSSESFTPGTDLEQLEAQRVAHATELERAWHELRGALDTLEPDLPDVAEAEETMAAATEDLARIHELAGVIDETLRLLRDAQDRVHRDLAPVLASAVRRWLAMVSDGAYVDVSVDPADLSVQVKEAASGKWRTARLLSEGTREQIYLLLRVAMAQHLVTAHETAPLILDEVTAQSDEHRRAALLAMLHQLSGERQVILFSHDAEVAAWARRKLTSGRDRLIALPALRDQGRKVIPIPVAATPQTAATRRRPRQVAARS